MSSNIKEVRDEVRALKAELQGMKVDLEKTKTSLTEVLALFRDYYALADEIGLPKNVSGAIRELLLLQTAAETTYRAILMMYTATGPIGWLAGIASFGLGALMLRDRIEMRRPRY